MENLLKTHQNLLNSIENLSNIKQNPSKSLENLLKLHQILSKAYASYWKSSKMLWNLKSIEHLLKFIENTRDPNGSDFIYFQFSTIFSFHV